MCWIYTRKGVDFCAPIFFSSWRKENGRARSKEKSLFGCSLMASCAGKGYVSFGAKPTCFCFCLRAPRFAQRCLGKRWRS